MQAVSRRLRSPRAKSKLGQNRIKEKPGVDHTADLIRIAIGRGLTDLGEAAAALDSVLHPQW